MEVDTPPAPESAPAVFVPPAFGSEVEPALDDAPADELVPPVLTEDVELIVLVPPTAVLPAIAAEDPPSWLPPVCKGALVSVLPPVADGSTRASPPQPPSHTAAKPTTAAHPILCRDMICLKLRQVRILLDMWQVGNRRKSRARFARRVSGHFRRNPGVVTRAQCAMERLSPKPL